jgi:hypothetical protein
VADEPLDPAERAREKEESRRQDEEDLAAGRITREELNRRNSFIDWSKIKITILWDKIKHDV